MTTASNINTKKKISKSAVRAIRKPKNKIKALPRVAVTKQITILEQSENILRVRVGKNFLSRFVQEKDDPAVALNVYSDNLTGGINAVNMLPVHARPNSVLPVIYPLTNSGFVAAVLSAVSNGVTNGGIVDNFCICPNTLEESTAVVYRFGELNLDPLVLLIAHHGGGHLGRLHCFHNRKTIQTSSTFNLPRPRAMVPANIQAFV